MTAVSNADVHVGMSLITRAMNPMFPLVIDILSDDIEKCERTRMNVWNEEISAVLSTRRMEGSDTGTHLNDTRTSILRTTNS